MTQTQLTDLLALVKEKNQFDQHNAWFKGSISYLEGLKSELNEIEEELPKNRRLYLEDELADTLWNLFNYLTCLQQENKISTNAVIERAIEKYQQRLTAIQSGDSWQNIKESQQSILKKRQEALDSV